MHPHDESVTVKEAARRIGYSTRQTDRFIKAGELEASHVNRSLRTVTVASIDAFNSRHAHRPVDPLSPVKDQLQTQEQLAGDILRQLALLRHQMNDRDAIIEQRNSTLEGQIRQLKTQLQQERDARHTLEQTVATLSLTGTVGSQEEVMHLLHTLLGRTPRAALQQGQSPPEKRGYSPDTIRLVHFAEQHGIEPSTLRQHAEKIPGLATIYERQNATTKKREWWLTPEQKCPLLQYWQGLNKAMIPCPDCPHEGERSRAEMPEEERTAMKTATGGADVEHFHHISG